MPYEMNPGPGNWYNSYPAPVQPPQGGYTAPNGCPPSRETPAQRRRRRRTKALTLTACGLLVCLAVAVTAVNGGLFRRLWDAEAYVRYRAAQDDPYAGRDELLPAEDFRDFEDYRDYFANYYTSSDEIALPTAPSADGVTLELAAQEREELPLQEIYDRVSPAVVGIHTYLDDMDFGWGTGVVFTPDGYLITNTHVLQSCTKAEVVFTDGTKYEASLVGSDTASDIAVLHIDGSDLPYAQFGQSDALKVGDTAVAIGNPLSSDYAGTMTNGIISAIDRNVVYEGHTMTLLQTNAALNEGNSGGPLINGAGQVIGITNMKIMNSYTTATVEGIGFAIPSSVVKQIADQLLANGVVSGAPTIGIVAGSVGLEAMELYDLPEGIYVTEVNDGSDAKAQGLLPGDVITAVNGEHVRSVADVNFIKEQMQVGDKLELTVYRDGETFRMEIALVDSADIG